MLPVSVPLIACQTSSIQFSRSCFSQVATVIVGLEPTTANPSYVPINIPYLTLSFSLSMTMCVCSKTRSITNSMINHTKCRIGLPAHCSLISRGLIYIWSTLTYWFLFIQTAFQPAIWTTGCTLFFVSSLFAIVPSRIQTVFRYAMVALTLLLAFFSVGYAFRERPTNETALIGTDVIFRCTAEKSASGYELYVFIVKTKPFDFSYSQWRSSSGTLLGFHDAGQLTGHQGRYSYIKVY